MPPRGIEEVPAPEPPTVKYIDLNTSDMRSRGRAAGLLHRPKGGPVLRLQAIFCTIIIGLAVGPARAALPPWAYDELAARAPVVVIGRVVKVEAVGMAGVFTHLVTSLKILAAYRGKVAPGATVRTMFALWHKGVPPSAVCYYSRKLIQPGRVFLLFLAPGRDGEGYRLAAHGSRVFRLDGPRRAVLDRLDKAARRTRINEPPRARPIGAYKWAAAWVNGRKAKRSNER